eukprot:1162137-Pelagomonas_calceolata.AAC.13
MDENFSDSVKALMATIMDQDPSSWGSAWHRTTRVLLNLSSGLAWRFQSETRLPWGGYADGSESMLARTGIGNRFCFQASLDAPCQHSRASKESQSKYDLTRVQRRAQC